MAFLKFQFPCDLAAGPAKDLFDQVERGEKVQVQIGGCQLEMTGAINLFFDEGGIATIEGTFSDLPALAGDHEPGGFIFTKSAAPRQIEAYRAWESGKTMKKVAQEFGVSATRGRELIRKGYDRALAAGSAGRKP